MQQGQFSKYLFGICVIKINYDLAGKVLNLFFKYLVAVSTVPVNIWHNRKCLDSGSSECRNMPHHKYSV